MGRHPAEDRDTVTTPTIGHTWPHHKSMARALIAGGLRPGELAKAYGMSTTQISVITNSPLFKAEVERLEKLAEASATDFRGHINDVLVPKAMDVLEEDLDLGADDVAESVALRRLRQTAAFEVLERGDQTRKRAPIGIGKVNIDKVNINNMPLEEVRTSVFDMIEAEFTEVD